jgi:hypothetical protein
MPLLANEGKASACHTKGRKTKREEETREFCSMIPVLLRRYSLLITYGHPGYSTLEATNYNITLNRFTWNLGLLVLFSASSIAMRSNLPQINMKEQGKVE